MALPGLRGTEHIGFTVPDLDEAHRFFVDVIGCEYVYSLGPFERDDDWLTEHLNVHPRSVMRELRFYRCEHGPNFEVFQWEPADGQRDQPRNSDLGGHHLAFYVDDLDAATAYLWSHGVRVLGEPTASRNASEGQRWVYFLSPWGMQFELVSFPNGKAYEATSAVKLWDPPGTGGMSAVESLGPVPRDGSASRRVAASIREAISHGEYAPGSRLRQEEIAERFGASRVPVREALRELEAEGLVTLVPNAGAWVSRLSLRECEEVYQTRERLEPLLMHYSAPNLSTENLDEMDALARAMAETDDLIEFLRLDREFHMLSYSGAETLMLGDLVRRLWNTTQPYRRAYTTLIDVHGQPIVHDEHRHIVATLRDGDAEGAARTVEGHIRRTRRMLAAHPEVFSSAG